MVTHQLTVERATRKVCLPRPTFLPLCHTTNIIIIIIQTDHVIEHRWPDIVVVVKDNKMALLIDITVLGDTKVEDKKQEQIDKY